MCSAGFLLSFLCHCHILFVTSLHLFHCICHIVAITLYMSHCIYNIVYVILHLLHWICHIVSITLYLSYCTSITLYLSHCIYHIVSVILYLSHRILFKSFQLEKQNKVTNTWTHQRWNIAQASWACLRKKENSKLL